MILGPNQVYVIAPAQQVRLLHDQLHCMPASNQTRPNRPIDVFLKSLAEDRGSKAIGVILSGTGSDGTLGTRAIKEAGGITFAQDSESAEYDAMPANAGATGNIDFVLPPSAIAQELGRLARHPSLRSDVALKQPEQGIAVAPELLSKIHILLRSRVGHDFSNYQQTTVQRRIRRRMLLHKLDSAARYVQLLQHDPRELDALFQDILINVTAFFRDPESFEALKHTAFPSLLKQRPLDLPIRIWVPGCSTGQEVYSIAMALHECLGDQAARTGVQIFVSDIDNDAIEKARAGVYPEGIKADLSAVRLKRYFRKVAGGYRVSKVVRDQCIFAAQNVTRDPPFSRIDLVSCRNLLIYFETVLQKKVLQLFHYALQPDGFLLLGSSEAIGGEAVSGQDARKDNLRLRVDGDERRVAIQVLSLGARFPKSAT